MHNHSKGIFDPSDGLFDDSSSSPADPGAADAAASGGLAFGDLGTIATLTARGNGGSSGPTSTAAAAPAPTLVTTAGSGLVFNLEWDTSVASAPAGFMSDVIAAAKMIEGVFGNAVTINLAVGYNEIAGTSLQSGALGESETNIDSVSYATLLGALRATASSDATDASVLASLPATSPISGTFYITTTQAKALGLAAANGSGLDAAIGFGTGSEFTFGDTNTSGTVAGGTYDFFATALHEMTETMGRLLLVGTNLGAGPGYSLMDLLHYSAPGTRDFTQSTPGYFSPDGGATNLGAFNTISGGDAGDWSSSVARDSFDAFATPGVLEPAGANDMTLMDAIGWNVIGASAAPPPPPPQPSPPVVTNQTPTETVTEGQAFSFTLASNTFTDPQNEALTLTATLANGQPLPSGVNFNGTTRTFSGTAPSIVENLSVKVTATDTSNLSASETFALDVVAPQPKPGISVTNPIPNQTWHDGQSVNFVVPASTFTDALGLKMSFAAYELSGTNVTGWLHFNATTETFFGTVPANATGSALLEIVARDSARASAADMFSVTFAPAGTAHQVGALAAIAPVAPDQTVAGAAGMVPTFTLHS
jgi:hypothetical protein